MSFFWFACLFWPLFIPGIAGDYTVTIYPQYLSQGGRTHFETDRWDGHMGLDTAGQIKLNKAIGTESGRWNHEDLRHDIFEKATEDPHRKGYADPKYFKNPEFEALVASKYLENLKGYGFDLDMVMELKGKNWPHWMNTSLHNGTFPNNLDAGAEMALHLLEAISRHTKGHVPPYLEPINEPGTLWRTVKWPIIIDYYRIMVQKLKRRFPAMKFVGPANTGVADFADKDDFKVWYRLQEFMDMSLEHLDFYSFHPFNRVHTEGDSHDWSGGNEARFCAILDLIESYAWKKKGKAIPIMITAYGLAGDNVKVTTTTNFAEWAFGYIHNAQMFTFLNLRGIIDRAVAFLLSKSHDFASSTILRQNHTYTPVAKSYQFWNRFTDKHRFLRVDSLFDGKERLISPLAMANPHTKEVHVLLHNYRQTASRVKLVFHNQWTHTSSAKSTCYSVNSHNTAVFVQNREVSLVGNVFIVPAEASCYITLKSAYNFPSIPTVHEHTYYAKQLVSPIKGHAIDTDVNVPPVGEIQYAAVRVAVSVKDKSAQTKPRTVQVNGHMLAASYALYSPGKRYSETLWDVHVFKVPPHVLKHNSNTVRLSFAQHGGYVSSVAVVIGTLSTSGVVIG